MQDRRGGQGRDWRQVATNQGVPRIENSHKKLAERLKMHSFPGHLEKSIADTLIAGFRPPE
jgi:hypothetical protein